MVNPKPKRKKPTRRKPPKRTPRERVVKRGMGGAPLTDRYVDYIKSPQWKAKRERYWAKYGRKCHATEGCGEPEGATLHVHHVTYARFGRERMEDLQGLCVKHHRMAHKPGARGKRI